MKETLPSLFISYSWKNRNIAEIIENDLREVGIKIVKDTSELRYKSDIQKFMSKIRQTDFAILLLSDDYFKSKNCLFEAFELLKENNKEEKILPIVANDVNFFNPQDRIKYIRYWQDQKGMLEKELHTVSTINAISIYEELRFLNQICLSLDNFLKTLASIKNITFSRLKEEKYKSLFLSMGFEDRTYLIELLSIIFIDDLDKREIALDEYFENYHPNTYSYSARAGLAKKKGNLEKAILNYTKAIQLDPNNVTALNNLGYILDQSSKGYDKAKELYEKAISIDSSLIIARMNLAVLLCKGYDDEENAIKQYEEILKIDPFYADAYNNLGNIYRGDKHKNLQKAEEYLLKALEINPRHYNANLNYANFLEVVLKNYENAKKYYEQAVKFGYNKDARQIADLMLKRLTEKYPHLAKKIGRNDLCPCSSQKKYKNCHGSSGLSVPFRGT